MKMTEAEYYHWSTIEDGWLCPTCQKEALPFHNVSDNSIWSHNSSFQSQSSTQDVNIDPTTATVLTINARSLLPKVGELRGLCTYRCYMAIVVTETWLSPEVLDNELAVDGYNLVRRDRNRHGGGVAIFIHNSLPFKPLHAELELVALSAYLTHALLPFYRPPNSNEITQLFSYFEATKLS